MCTKMLYKDAFLLLDVTINSTKIAQTINSTKTILVLCNCNFFVFALVKRVYC